MENHFDHNRVTTKAVPQQNPVVKWTLICVGVAIVAILAVKVFNVSVNTLAFGAVLLACPLMHIFMMKGGGHKH